jgi:xanthine/uracil permease
MNFENMGGRRFVLSILTLLSTFVLTWFAKIDAATYSIVIVATVGALITGHTTENIKSLVASKNEPKP